MKGFIALALIVALVAGAVWIGDIIPAIMEAGKTTPAVLQNICRELTGLYSMKRKYYMTAVSVAVGWTMSVMSLVLPRRACFIIRR